MQAHVKSDQTVRTIAIEIEPGSIPDYDVTRSWHRKPRVIRPDSLTVITHDGELTRVTLSGGLVLKSGGASSESRHGNDWQGDYGDQKLADLPGRLSAVVQAVLDGQTTWHGAEAQAL
jgi:hypothetical protein